MSQLVSIVIAAYKPNYLLETIDSVLQQTYRPIEIVVVDDGSPHNLRPLLEDHIRNGTIRYVHRENGKMGAARNTGIQHSTGELIAFLDDDDLWVPDKLEKQVPLFANPDVHLVYAWAIEFLGDQVMVRPPFKNVEARGHIFGQLFVDNFIPSGTVVARREALQRVGVFNETPAYVGIDDYDMWLRITHEYGVDLVPEELLRTRLHAHQVSGDAEFMVNQELAIKEDLVQRFGVSRRLRGRAYAHIFFRFAYHKRVDQKATAAKYYLKAFAADPRLKYLKAILLLPWQR
jgi:glycosyltransferase involved in cell wall biosynthesis